MNDDNAPETTPTVHIGLDVAAAPDTIGIATFRDGLLNSIAEQLHVPFESLTAGFAGPVAESYTRTAMMLEQMELARLRSIFFPRMMVLLFSPHRDRINALLMSRSGRRRRRGERMMQRELRRPIAMFYEHMKERADG